MSLVFFFLSSDNSVMKSTLIIVDVQYDFLEGGSLAVQGADAAYVRSIEAIKPLFDQVVLTADHHPADHISFKGTFPPHCVQGTHGAEIAVSVSPGDVVLFKGEDSAVEEFSAFGNGKHIDILLGDAVFVAGLAGDICVRTTIKDILTYARQKKVYAITDLIYSVNGQRYGEVDYFGGKVFFVASDSLSRILQRGL